MSRHVSFELRCPKDNAPMQRVVMDGLTLDRCAACGAIWFDMGEVERVLGMKRRIAAAIDTGATQALDVGKESPSHRTGLRCPRDSEPLTHRIYPEQSHIVVDECKFCHGMLMDAGELTDAADFTIAERVKNFFE